MRGRLEQLTDDLKELVASLDGSALDATDACAAVEMFATIEKLAVAGRMIAMARVTELAAWRASAHRSAAQWLAARTGSSVGSAIDSVHTAQRLRVLPATREALVEGKLSEVQAAEITSAAVLDPRAEASLLQAAEKETVASLKGKCREVRAAAVSDEDAAQRIRESRYLRDWQDEDGAVRIDGRFAPDDGARLLAAIRARAAAMSDEARRSGQRERAEAYAADAIVALAEGTDGPRAVVHVQVDGAALARGRTEPGEMCRIEGVGPVPVEVVERMVPRSSVKVVGRDGAAVTDVVHLGRSIPARVRSALEARDPACVVPDCDVRSSLEIDHIVPFSRGGETRLENLARLCRFHHGQKTHHGWALGGSPGAWTWTRSGGPGRNGRPPPARGP